MNGEAVQRGGISRREVLGAGSGGLIALLLEPSWIATVRAQGVTRRDDPRYAFADRLAELVIPATDTPGAAAAGVAGFMLLALDHGIGDLEPAMLDAVDRTLKEAGGQPFLSLPATTQTGLLEALDRRAYADKPAVGSPEHAWRRLKAAIVAGYYTSEIGASQELVYEPVPGAFRNFKLGADFRARSNDGLGGTL